ncbi:MAG: TIGR04282 family arsenosugar biosynthesis glycosyltransferase, partial [Deltaproteobacteria bacterium]|nr:TIGR04282 family arsenosugar biosynthesis glycosyltransferase [Deltaproteobacteria bacterium]
MTGSPRLILMTRFPVPGKAKTRLVPVLGAEGAALLHRRMTERTLEIASAVDTEQPTEIEVCYTDAAQSQMREWLGPNVQLRDQHPGDLGQRMWHAFAAAFDDGATTAVLIGADTPDLNADHLRLAFDSLRDNDLVLGPAEDGGYYLIGLSRPIPELFHDVPWSTDRVAEQTLQIAVELVLKIAQLDMLSDVDRPEDLARVPE